MTWLAANWQHMAAVVPIAVIAFALWDTFFAGASKTQAQEELELVCACCGLEQCDRDGMVWCCRKDFDRRMHWLNVPN